MSKPALIRQRFLNLDGRRIRYLRAGSGSPALLVHSSPGHAGMLTRLINRLSPRHTVFAFDNPGFGSSDPLELDAMMVADAADALAETLRSMKFPATPVYGSHTGAAIGLELGVRHPDLVSGLILDGVPIFTRAEVEARTKDGYFFRDEPHPLGGHLTNTWTRFRDQMTFHPWCTKTAENAHTSGLYATPEAVHEWMSMFFCSGRNFEKPYRAAHDFGEVAPQRIMQLERPAVFTAISTDGLARHFSRFPSLKKDQEIIALDGAAESRMELLEACIQRFDSHAPPPPEPPQLGKGAGISKLFVDLPDGQVLVRTSGLSSQPALLLLHDAPGSALSLEPMISALGRSHRVYAPDLPGCGCSDALPGLAPQMVDYVTALLAVCSQLGITETTAYGVGVGASIAVELARAAPRLVTKLVLRGVLLPDAADRQEMLANYAPAIEIEASGGHWYRTWLMLRDSLVYWPWYRRGSSAVRRVTGDFSADRLHDWTVEVMRQYHSYHHVILAAIAYDAAQSLGEVDVPMLVCADPIQPFSAYQSELQALVPAAEIFEASDPCREADTISAFTEPTRQTA